MKLEIITPEKIEFSGIVTSVTLPGTKGKFTVLENHASLIASLAKGVIRFNQVDSGLQEFYIDGGLCEVNKNQVFVCVEQNEIEDGKIK